MAQLSPHADATAHGDELISRFCLVFPLSQGNNVQHVSAGIRSTSHYPLPTSVQRLPRLLPLLSPYPLPCPLVPSFFSVCPLPPRLFLCLLPPPPSSLPLPSSSPFLSPSAFPSISASFPLPPSLPFPSPLPFPPSSPLSPSCPLPEEGGFSCFRLHIPPFSFPSFLPPPLLLLSPPAHIPSLWALQLRLRPLEDLFEAKGGGFRLTGTLFEPCYETFCGSVWAP